ncbi:MAG: choice-of-anchor Q domain-containing protein [Saprospiraceae bacterium]
MNFAHSGTANPQFAACHFRGNTSLYGGAIHNSGIENGLSSPILTSCTFEGNAAQSYGGAVYNDGKDGNSSPKFKNCRFSSNSSAFHGGAIYNNGDDGVSSPTIKSCVFESNFANAGGGAIFNHGDAGTSSPMIDSCVFTKNTTEGGGGAICNFSSSQGYVNPIISQCLFSENSAPAGVGGAIWDSPPYGTCKPVYSNCVFADNSAGNGGAFKSSGGAGYSPMLLNCVFAKNAAVKYGGAMSYIWEGGTYPTLINCAFWGNTAEEGGGLYGFSNPSAHPRVINCSFSNNRATTYGGAMNNRTCDGCSTPDFAINNCVFWDNHAPAGKSMYNSWATPQLFHTLLQETICPPGAYCHTPSMLYNQDPLFLDQNGNMRLQAGSPAINTGQNAALPDSVQYDLDGNLRIMGPAVDRGAYEFEEAVGVKYALANAPMQNFDITPNPFSEQADIQFLLTEGAHIRLRIIDLFGNPLMDRARYYPPGYHHETFQSESKVPSGILFCEIITPSGGSVIKKIIQLDRH